MDTRNSTLNELLSEPIIRQLMASDGVRIDEIHRLLREARARMLPNQSSEPLCRSQENPARATVAG